ncbi:MAG: ankyrin repeat domain-containing protein [Bacteroidia bacterium]|nr:ankyrin repeat domain-containing protein [Bacteroidia bacterium]
MHDTLACGRELMQAARDNNLARAQQLIDAGCGVNARVATGTDQWISPLSHAIVHADPAMVRLLLQHGADPCQDLGYNSPPLYSAAGTSTREVLLLLLDKCPNLNLMNDGRSLLSQAIAGRRMDNVVLLVERGAKLDPDSSYDAPLVVAAQHRQVEIFSYLLAQGADVNVRFSMSGEDCMPCSDSITLLHHLVDMRKYEDSALVRDLLETLMAYSPEMNIESAHGLTALEHACFDTDTAMADWLISRGAALETDDYTALHVAARYSNDSMVAYLLRKGANPNARTRKGDTPLLLSYTCCGDGFGEGITTDSRIKTTRLLLAYGADPSITNHDNKSWNDLCNTGLRKELCDTIQKDR